jgi:hypothetical protein
MYICPKQPILMPINSNTNAYANANANASAYMHTNILYRN